MYNKFIYIIQLIKNYNYDEYKMYENFQFKIKDLIINSILYVANKYSLNMANILGRSDID